MKSRVHKREKTTYLHIYYERNIHRQKTSTNSGHGGGGDNDNFPLVITLYALLFSPSSPFHSIEYIILPDNKNIIISGTKDSLLQQKYLYAGPVESHNCCKIIFHCNGYIYVFNSSFFVVILFRNITLRVDHRMKKHSFIRHTFLFKYS